MEPFRIDRAMIVKLAFFVLLLVVALGLVGRALPRRKGPAPRPIQAMAKCPACGVWRLRDAPCATPGCKG